MEQQRRKYTGDYKVGVVQRLHESSATQGSVTMMNKRAFVTANKAQYAVSILSRLLEI